ncbi:MAG: (Fe-S)-binding protein [Bacilli bacterium]
MIQYLLYALYAFLVLLGLGVILGIALVISEKFLHVEEDKRISDVEKMLPNFNCGACGRAGCHAMAEAIVTGDCKKISDCKAGKKDKNYDPIIQYMDEHPDADGTKHVPTI